MATTAQQAEFQNGGKPVAQPVYQVDSNGNPVNTTAASGSPASLASTPLIAAGMSTGTSVVPLRQTTGDGGDGSQQLAVQAYTYDPISTTYSRIEGRNGIQAVSTGGMRYAVVAAGTAADTVIKNAPGRLGRILITATGTNPLQIFDNASAGSGNVIGVAPASPAVGSIYESGVFATAGITVKGNASNPGFTVLYD